MYHVPVFVCVCALPVIQHKNFSNFCDNIHKISCLQLTGCADHENHCQKVVASKGVYILYFCACRTYECTFHLLYKLQ
jgi:hypothetical protein